MSTVFKTMGLRHRKTGDIGLEIEVEGVNLPQLHLPVQWRADQDGSLRGLESAEYVLREPLTLPLVKQALDNLDKCYIKNKTTVDETIRAGVHVHINCQQLTMTQLYTFMTLYLVLENLLLKYCGDTREGNLFCLRTSDAEFALFQIVEAAKDQHFSMRFESDQLRYASMNVKALSDYGSLEFRAMRGTRDLGAIYKWAEILLSLRDAAIKEKCPSSIIGDFSTLGPESFIKKYLGPNAAYFLTVKDFKQNLFTGMRLAQLVAFSVDWKDWEKKDFNELVGKKITTKYIDIGELEFPDDGIFKIEPMEDF
jgi:hypothetical protein